MKYDVVVIGAGPGGARAASLAAHAGLSVALVERGNVGGVCLNEGCIPTKTLVAAGHRMQAAKRGDAYGVTVDACTIDGAALFAKKNAVIETLRKGSEASIKKQPYTFISGEAHFVSDHEIAVGEEFLSFSQAIIATGSRPTEIPSIPCDGKKVLNSTQMLGLNTLPKSIAIIGGGYIGCEWASLLLNVGVEVHVVEMMKSLLPVVTPSTAKRFELTLKKAGCQLHLGTAVSGVSVNGNGVSVLLEGGEPISVDAVLVSVGRTANIDTCAIEKAGVAIERGCITTNEYLQSSVPHIYAVGDVVNSPQLAHTAFHEADVAVQNIISAQSKTVVYDTIPNVIFTDPEIASVGTPGRAPGVKETRVPFGSNGKAHCESAIDGVFSLFTDEASGKIVGAEMFGLHATELISYIAMAMHLDATVQQLKGMVFPHPTLCEIVADAFEMANG